MNFGLNDEGRAQLADLIRAIDANTEAIERANDLRDAELNGPR
jgi:DNA-binding PadR family transcriptional regulator